VRNKGPCIVAIDGPAASGKSTVAAGVAAKTGFLLIDSGSMYRAVTLLAIREGVDPGDEDGLRELAMRVRSGYGYDGSGISGARVTLSGEDVSGEIRSPEVGGAVSRVSAVPAVREEMVALQREIAGGACAVVEGRDIGTRVFPDAQLKVYLEASPGERARRRKGELDARGLKVTGRQVEDEISMRDAIDSSREASPLAKADDAVTLDTDGKSVPEVVEEIVALLKER